MGLWALSTAWIADGLLQPIWQSMFSLYVHPGLDYDFPADSFLFGKAISERVKVEWGQFSVVSHRTYDPDCNQSCSSGKARDEGLRFLSQ